jgi:hypothetical protein
MEQLRLRGGVACRPRCPKKEQDLQARAFHEPLRQGTLQLLPSLVQLQTQVVLALWREPDSRATADFLLPGKAYV